MRIRRSLTSSVSPSSPPTPSPSPSSCSSSSSCFSSHSTISTHSLSSSSNSTSSSSSPLSAANPRCHGLDLLVKAVYYVAGSVIGVPYIQRRVIRRRKPALRFANLVINSDQNDVGDLVEDDENVVDFKTTDLIEIPKKINKNSNAAKKPQKRRSKAVPLKYNDSVLQALKPRDRRRRRSIK